MPLDKLRKTLNNIGDYRFVTNNELQDEEINNDIYDLIRILDKFKNNRDFSKLYKTDFDYDRDGNKVSFIFTINNLRKSKNFEYVFSSEFVKNFFNDLSTLNGISNNFIRRMKSKNNYKLNMFGNKGIYQTPYFTINFQ